jgi:putative ABC transport system substrate-binding protein
MQFDRLNRRHFISLLGSVVAWPIAARAQQPGRVWRVGFLTAVPFETFSRLYAGFQQGMRELGYLEGKDYISEWRSVEGKYERVSEIAAELVRLKVDVIVTGTIAALPTLKRTITTIPIVMANSTDPVGNGLVTSLARPGGNMTGLAGSYDDSSPKQLELLAMVVPNGSRIGLLGNPNNTNYSSVLKSTQDAVQKTGLSLVPLEARNPQEIENAFAAFAKEGVPAVMVAGDAVFFGPLANCRAGARKPSADDVPVAGICGGRWIDELWREPGGFLSPRRILRGQDFQGRKTRRAADRAAHALQSGDQSQDRRCARRHHPAAALHIRGRSDRMKMLLPRCMSPVLMWWTASGTCSR